MAALQISTWDILPADGGASRPSLAMVGGAQVKDRGAIDKGSDIYADLINQLQRQVAAMGGVVPTAVVWVRYAAGVGSVYRAIGPGANVSSLGFFTLDTPGPHVVGTTRIKWTAGPLPPLTADPRVAVHEGPCGVPWGKLVVGDPNAVDVFTVDTSNSAVDLNFSVAIY
jgi:hypothetical protein